MYQHRQDQADRLPVKPVEAFLLLACFVGTALEEKDQLIFGRRKKLRDAYESLGVLKPTDLSTLSEQTLIIPPDCYWTQVEDLGWTFGGEDGCYSFRNKENPDDDGDSFPIQRFDTLLQQL